MHALFLCKWRVKVPFISSWMIKVEYVLKKKILSSSSNMPSPIIFYYYSTRSFRFQIRDIESHLRTWKNFSNWRYAPWIFFYTDCIQVFYSSESGCNFGFEFEITFQILCWCHFTMHILALKIQIYCN